MPDECRIRMLVFCFFDMKICDRPSQEGREDVRAKGKRYGGRVDRRLCELWTSIGYSLLQRGWLERSVVRVLLREREGGAKKRRWRLECGVELW